MYFQAFGDNFDEAVEVFASSYNLLDLSIVPTEMKFHWSHIAYGDEIMTFRENKMFARMVTTLATDDEFVVAWGVSGYQSYEQGRTLIEPALRTPFVVPHGRFAMRATAVNTVERVVHIDRRFVAGVAEELEGVDFDTFEIFAAASDRALAHWRKAVDLVASVVIDSSEPSSSLLRNEMSRLIAVAMLSTFPYSATDPVSRPYGIEPICVKLAHDFIHDNAHLPITVTEIAQAAGLSVRSLQHALRRYRETTPNALLQLTRLNRTHAELVASDPRHETVAAVARRWGFVHLGRFSTTYRAKFGQLPSKTLHDVRYTSKRPK